jgi:thioredoxin-related protein
MKKPLYLSLIILLLSCSDGKVHYFDTDFQNAFKLAAKNDRMVFIDFYTVWCGPCQYFDKNLKYDSVFKSYMTENFYTLHIDAELEKSKEIVSRYNPSGYPTFVITDSNGEEIDRIVGLKENSSESFIGLIKSVLTGNDELALLKEQYFQLPDSIELFRKIILDKLLGKQLYNSAIEFSEFAIFQSKDSALIQEAKYFKAYASIRNPKAHSSNLMSEFVNSINNLQLIEYGYEELFFHYRTNINLDSMRICLDKLVSFKSENHLKYVRDYAEFLYKHDKDIDYANVLTKEYTETSGSNEDHWTPYLNAHKLAKQGQLEKGIESFDYWMTKNSKPENFRDDYWHYKFYIDLILYYKVASKQAIMYSEMFERNNPNIENTKQLAELYFYNGQIDEAVDKIKELVVMVEDPKEKKKYDQIIKEYIENQ